MRNVLIIDLGRHYGGAEKYVEQICSLLGNDYSFHLLLRNKSLFHKRCIKNNKPQIVAIDFSARSILSDLNRIRQYILENKIEIIHAQGINSEVFVYLLQYFLRDKKIRYISTVHGIAEMDRIQKKKVERFLFAKIQVIALKRFDSIIAVSNSIKNDLKRKGIDPEKIEVIYQSVDCTVIRDVRTYEKHSPLRICCVGRLEKVKNFQFLIEVLSLVKGKNKYICDIYGEGSQREFLENKIRDEHLDGIVNLMGYTEDVYRVYRNHDILIQPSFYESFGLSVIEAIISGIPVICSNAGGMAEIVEDKQTGFLFEVNDKDELLAILNGIFEGRYNLDKIVENAGLMVKERFSKEEHERKLTCMYGRG